MLNNQNLAFQAQPKFIDILKKSAAASTTKGKSHFEMRPPQPTKTSQDKRFIEEMKDYYENRIVKLKEEMDNLRCQMHDIEQYQIKAAKDRDELAKLYDRGLINSDGEAKE